MSYDLKGKRVWVAGHRGMVGGALVRRLKRENCELITMDRGTVDFRRQAEVEVWTADAKPEVVIIAAARVGGIHANDSFPADFIYDNLVIETNIVHATFKSGVEKLLFLGSSCIYPRNAPQPIPEEALLTGPLEATNQWYALAKIAGIKLCEAYRRQHGCDFISVTPTNVFGPGDNFHPENSHVPAALLRRFHEAKNCGASKTAVWGTGAPRREFLYVDDFADACIFLLKTYSDAPHINVGTGQDLPIRDFAEKVKAVVGYDGALEFDTSRPTGTPRKVLDVSRLTAMGWTASTSLDEGLRLYYDWFLENIDRLRQ